MVKYTCRKQDGRRRRKASEESPDCVEQGTEGNFRRETAGVFYRKAKETNCELTQFESNSDESDPKARAKDLGETDNPTRRNPRTHR